MPRYATLDEITQARRPQRREATLDEITGNIASAANMGQTWVREDINNRDVDISNYMRRASDRIQSYQQARSDIGEDRLTANEQVAIVDAYRQIAGLQPEGYYLTKEGAAIPEDKFAEIRRKRTEDDAWENFKSNMSHTVLQNLAGIRGVQARITDALGITTGAIAEATRESEEVTRILQPLGGKSGFAGQAIGNVMNLFLGYMTGRGLAGVAGKVGLGLKFGTSAPAMFAISTAGHTFIDVAQRREEGQEISPYTEWASAIANATIEYALESFGQSVARRAGGMLAGRMGDLRNAITRNGIRGGIRSAASILVKHGFQQTGMALEGAAEEGITELLQNTVRRLSYADEQKIFGGVGEAALQGAVMPLLAAGPMAAIQRGRGGEAGRPSPEIRAGLSPILPSQAAGDQTLSADRPLARIAQVEEALRSEETLPDNLKRSLPAENDIPDIRIDREISTLNLTDKWIGDRQLSQYKAGIEARNHRSELKNMLREGEQLNQVDAAIAVYIDMKENSDSYTVENIQQLTQEQQASIERAQSLSPDQQAFAEQIIAENKTLGIEGQEAGLFENYRENYSARFWKVGKFPGRKKARFTITTPRQRQRTLPSLIEGWAKGLELEVPGAIEAQMLAKQQISQVIHDRNLVTLGLKSGLFNQARTDEHTHRVKHPNFAKWVWTGKTTPIVTQEGVTIPEVKVYGKDVFADPEGNVYKRANVYTDKKTASYLNNALGSSELFNVKGIGEILKYNQVLKHAVLTMSGFHYFAFTRSYMLASRGLNPVKGYREGKELVLGKKPGMDQLVRGGLTLGDQMGLDLAAEREATRVGKLIEKIPIASQIRKSLIALSRANSHFLFNKFGTYLKANAAYLDYQHQLKKRANQIRDGKISEHEIAKQVANVYNDDFGGLNLQRMGRNPTIQALHRAVSLAPDWTESNIRTMVKAFKLGDEGAVYRGMWGRVLMKGIGATVLANLITAALDEEEDFLDQYKKAWNRGNLRWLDVDITSVYRMFGGKSPGRKYLSIIGHFRDPIKFVVTPPRAAKGKMSMLARMGWEMGSGQDWRGRTFTSFGELVNESQTTKYKPFKSGPIGWGQVPSYIIKQAEQSTPVAVQALINRMRGEIDTFDTITRSVGLPTVTAKPKKQKKRPRRQRRK